MVGVFTLATFNIKDLFDPAHEAKLATLAERIAEADPDVLGLEEVGSALALEGILARVPRGAEYTTRIVAPSDKRGIANALVARVPLMQSWVHEAADLPLPLFVEGDAPSFPGRIPLRRAMPHGRFNVPGLGPVDVLVAHWKSQHGTPLRKRDGTDIAPANAGQWAEADVRALLSRAAEALYVRGLLEETQRQNPRVALVGDLNDTLDSVPVRLVRQIDPALYPAAQLVPHAQRYSATHAGQHIQIDHVLVSAALRASLHSAEFFNGKLRDHGALKEEGPTPDSDHALFLTRFKTS